MSKLKSGFRVFGDELDREESYVDVEVAGTDVDGRIYFTDPEDSTEEWSFDAEELGRLYEEKLLIPADEIPLPNHNMWKVLEDIGEQRMNVDFNNFVDQNLRDSARSVFKALIEAGEA